MRIAIYVRCDFGNPAALERQRPEYLEYARREGHEVVVMYDDYAQSGSKFNRPGLQCLLRDARAGLFQAVLMADFSRLSRDFRVGRQITELLAECGVAISLKDVGVMPRTLPLRID